MSKAKKPKVELTPEERSEIGRKLAEARRQKAIQRQRDSIEYSDHILPLNELRHELNSSTEDYETTIFKLIECRKANIQSISEVTGLTYIEIRNILEDKSGSRYRDGY